MDEGQAGAWRNDPCQGADTEKMVAGSVYSLQAEISVPVPWRIEGCSFVRVLMINDLKKGDCRHGHRKN
jgi:hypothetical protein